MKCKECQDFFELYKCGICGKQISDCCKECHLELKHDIITPAMFTIGCGSPYYVKDEENGYYSVARKQYEERK